MCVCVKGSKEREMRKQLLGIFGMYITLRLFLGREATTNLDSELKNRDITLPTNVRIVKVMVFPVITYSNHIRI